MNNWLITEIIHEQERRRLERVSPHRLAALEEHDAQDGGVRRTIAGALIRLGTALDHDAAVPRAAAR